MFAIVYGCRWLYRRAEAESISISSSCSSCYADNPSTATARHVTRERPRPRALSEDLGDNNIKKYRAMVWPISPCGAQHHQVDHSQASPGRTTTRLPNSSTARCSDSGTDSMHHALANVGGIYIDNATIDNGKKALHVCREEASSATRWKFLIDEAFTDTRAWLFNNEISDYTPISYRTLTKGRIEQAHTQLHAHQLSELSAVGSVQRPTH